MYLNTVLTEVQRESTGSKYINAEHLYKLNEAIFNLPEDDIIDSRMSGKIFQGIQKIRQAYISGKVSDADQNFFYDYLALLGTMQNQHFFTAKQTESMMTFIKEGIDAGPASSWEGFFPPPPPPAAAPASQSSKADEKRLHKLEAENDKLRAEYEKLKASMPFEAIEVIKTWKLPDAKPKAEAKDKGKGSDGKGSEDKGSSAKGSGGKGSDGKGSEGKGSGAKGSGGKGSDGKGSGGKGSTGKGSGGKGSSGKGSDESESEPEEKAPRKKKSRSRKKRSKDEDTLP